MVQLHQLTNEVLTPVVSLSQSCVLAFTSRTENWIAYLPAQLAILPMHMSGRSATRTRPLSPHAVPLPGIPL